jgi:CDP-diacylglycerol--glycerol-3-phosphate 3-phosphatidyltransferase
MDPLADKMLVTAALVSLVANGLASAWMVAVILGREFAVTVLRSVLHARGHSLPASGVGKIKMASQVAAILLLILAPYIDEFYLLGQIAMWVATITALISAIDYSRRANAALGAKPVPSSASVNAQADRPPVSTRIRA